MDETLTVRRIEAPRLRRVTTQFAPERRAVVWPWICVAAILALGALGRPYDTTRGRLSSQAGEVLRLLP